MDELDTGAIAVDAAGVVRAANRPARKYLGLRRGRRAGSRRARRGAGGRERGGGAVRPTRRRASRRWAWARRGGAPAAAHGAGARATPRAAAGRVILVREISHEPLRRRFDELVGGLARAGDALRARREDAAELRGLARTAARASSRRAWRSRRNAPRAPSPPSSTGSPWTTRSPPRAIPDAQLLRERMRVARALAALRPAARARPRARAQRGGVLRERREPEAARSLTGAGGRAGAPGLPRLELRIERLRATLPLHLRVPRARGALRARRRQGLRAVFPETYSFHAERHDPAELYLQLEDLWTNPRLPRARGRPPRRRGAGAAPARGAAAHTSAACSTGSREDESEAALLRRGRGRRASSRQVVLRFVRDKQLEEHPRLRLAAFHLRKLLLRALRGAGARAGASGVPRGLRRGPGGGRAPEDRPTSRFFYALACGRAERIDAAVMGAARARLAALGRGRLPRRAERRLRGRELALRGAGGRGAARGRAAGHPLGARARDLTPFLRRPGQPRLPAHARAGSSPGSCASTTCTTPP